MRVMLDKNSCQAKVLELVQSYCLAHNKRPEVSESTDLLEDLGFTSLDVMELIETLEDTLDIALPINELAEVKTVKDLTEVVVKAAQ